jgi:hypothetical protein
MQVISRKERQFLEKWKTIRLQKWRYVFQQGCLYWGLPSAVISYWMFIRFETAQFQFTDFLIHSISFLIFGIGWGYLLFRGNEKRFQQVFSSDKPA